MFVYTVNKCNHKYDVSARSICIPLHGFHGIAAHTSEREFMPRHAHKRLRERILAPLHTGIVYTSICACHPCAGAMLIFSASFQVSRMTPEGNP